MTPTDGILTDPYTGKCVINVSARWSLVSYPGYLLGTSGGVMVSKLDSQNYTSEFESHWVSHSFGLVLNRSKDLRKLLPRISLFFSEVLPLWKWYNQRIIIFTNNSARVGHDTRSIFKRSLTGLNSQLSFSKTSCLTKAEEPSLPCYLPIAGGRIIGFIPFPRVLVLCEMQSVSSRIWTRVAVSISYDDNYYTTGATAYYMPCW